MVIAVLLAAAAWSALAADRVEGKRVPASKAAETKQLPQPIEMLAGRMSGELAAPTAAELAPLHAHNASAKPRATQIGIGRDVSALALGTLDSTWQTASDGALTTQLEIRSRGAAALRVGVASMRQADTETRIGSAATKRRL